MQQPPKRRHPAPKENALASLEEKERNALHGLSMSTLAKLHASKKRRENLPHRLFNRVKRMYWKVREREQHTLLHGKFQSALHQASHSLLHAPWIDLIIGLMIVCNLVIVIVETDALAKEFDPPGWTKKVSWFIIVSFFFELVFRLYVKRCAFWLEGVNILDFLLVTTDLIMNFVEVIAGPVLSVSFLRVVRLFKLARFAKVFHVCPELRLMLAGLLGSMKAIFWGTVLLVLFLVIWSVILVQFLHPLNQQIAEQGIYSDCERCAHVYSSVFQSLLVIFQQIVAGDSWSMVTVTVIEHYPYTVLIYGPMFLSIGLAVLNLILGVVVDVASEARNSLKAEVEEEKLITNMELRHKLLDICKAMDFDGSGFLDKSELKRGYVENGDFRDSLKNIGVREEDLDILWTLLDEKQTGLIGYPAFVAYCYKMTNSREEFMLAYIKYYVTIIKGDILEEIRLLNEVKVEASKHEIVDKEQHIESVVQQAPFAEIKGDSANDLEHTLVMTGSPTPLPPSLHTTSKIDRVGVDKESSAADGAMVQLCRNNLNVLLESEAGSLELPKDASDADMTNAGRHKEVPDSMFNGNKQLSNIFETSSDGHVEILAAIRDMKRTIDKCFESFERQITAESASPLTPGRVSWLL